MDPRNNKFSEYNILVADDNELELDILVDVVTSLGAKCETALNGEDLLAKLLNAQPGQYDLLITDIFMPGKTGFEVTAAYRASKHPDAFMMPIIGLSADTAPDLYEQAIASGMNSMALKPISVAAVSAYITILLEEGRTNALFSARLRENARQREEREAVIEQQAKEVAEMNKQLAVALEEAKQAARAKSTFLATMSHEIRTPLNAVIGFSEFLRDPKCTEPERKEYLDGILKSSNALISLINDILDLSKLESKSIEMKGGKCDLGSLFDEMQTVLRFKVKESKVDLRYSLAEDLPVIDLRPERIRQILLNLLTNAVKNTVGGSVHFTASFELTNSRTGTLVIKVSDTGIGIAPEKLKIIFDPFTQDGSVRGEKVYEGTGLGLPISKRLAEIAGGDLTAESTLGKGSTFTLTIPNVDIINEPINVADKTITPTASEKIQEQASSLPPEQNPEKRDLSHLKFTLVDDVAINLRVLKQHLKHIGVSAEQISLFTDASAALLALQTKCDNNTVILTDMWMPNMTGEEFARAIRDDKKLNQLKIIAVTADANASATFDMSIFDSILTKPVVLTTLYDTICSLC